MISKSRAMQIALEKPKKVASQGRVRGRMVAGPRDMLKLYAASGQAVLLRRVSVDTSCRPTH